MPSSRAGQPVSTGGGEAALDFRAHRSRGSSLAGYISMVQEKYGELVMGDASRQSFEDVAVESSEIQATPVVAHTPQELGPH